MPTGSMTPNIVVIFSIKIYLIGGDLYPIPDYTFSDPSNPNVLEQLMQEGKNVVFHHVLHFIARLNTPTRVIIIQSFHCPPNNGYQPLISSPLVHLI